MLEHNLATESELKAMEKKIDDVVEDAVEFADESPPVPWKTRIWNCSLFLVILVSFS